MSSNPQPSPAGPGRPVPAESILSLKRYQAGKRTVPSGVPPIKLSSNECSFGPSPRAREAYLAVADTLHRYPDPSQSGLRAAIAGVHGLKASRVVCGNGSDEMLDLLIRTYVPAGSEVILSQNHFEMCRIHAIAQGAGIRLAAEKDYCMDVEALLGQVTDMTRMVIIANPNNPTGTYLCGAEVRRLHARLPAEVMLVLDGAYAEYVEREDFDPGFGLVEGFGNVVVTRTFSKIYGLAALRIGWVYAPDHVVDVLERIRSPFNANAAALAAAEAAVRDQEHVAMIRTHNRRWLERFGNELPALGIRVIPGVANFYLLRFQAGGGKTAQAAAAFLESRGIIPRAVGSEHDNVLRITVGLDDENEAVLAALAEFMAGA